MGGWKEDRRGEKKQERELEIGRKKRRRKRKRRETSFSKRKRKTTRNNTSQPKGCHLEHEEESERPSLYGGRDTPKKGRWITWGLLLCFFLFFCFVLETDSRFQPSLISFLPLLFLVGKKKKTKKKKKKKKKNEKKPKKKIKTTKRVSFFR